MDGTIRRVQEGDAKSIATVQVVSWKSAYRGAIPDALLDALSVEEHTGNWKTILENPDLPIFVVETEIGLGGFCSLAASRDEDSNSEEIVEITAVYVYPDHWRMGYGTRLCEKALREARARDFRECTLWVLSENDPGQRFYEALGFSLDGSSKVLKKSGVELHQIRYRKNL